MSTPRVLEQAENDIMAFVQTAEEEAPVFLLPDDEPPAFGDMSIGPLHDDEVAALLPLPAPDGVAAARRLLLPLTLLLLASWSSSSRCFFLSAAQ